MDYVLRPAIDTVEHRGAQFRLVDPEGILLAARTHRLELLHDARFPAPVRRAAFSVATEGPEPGPILFQDHGAKVRFRNLWILPKK